MKPTVVRLSETVRERIAALVGASGMAGFIREAVDAELTKREKASGKSSKNPALPIAKPPE